MLVTRREGFASAPVAAGAARGRGTKRARTAESSFDQITLSARAGQETSTAFRDLAAALQGAVVKDEEKDKISWKEYLENVMKKRGSEWLPLYRACRELNGK